MKGDSKSLEILIKGEDKDVNVHNNHILVYCVFPSNLPYVTGHFPNPNIFGL